MCRTHIGLELLVLPAVRAGKEFMANRAGETRDFCASDSTRWLDLYDGFRTVFLGVRNLVSVSSDDSPLNDTCKSKNDSLKRLVVVS